MRGAFGKPQGTVARVNIGQVIMSVRTKDGNKASAIEALRRAKFKFPGRQKVIAVELHYLDLSRERKNWRDARKNGLTLVVISNSPFFVHMQVQGNLEGESLGAFFMQGWHCGERYHHCIQLLDPVWNLFWVLALKGFVRHSGFPLSSKTSNSKFRFDLGSKGQRFASCESLTVRIRKP